MKLGFHRAHETEQASGATMSLYIELIKVLLDAIRFELMRKKLV